MNSIFVYVTPKEIYLLSVFFVMFFSKINICGKHLSLVYFVKF